MTIKHTLLAAVALGALSITAAQAQDAGAPIDLVADINDPSITETDPVDVALLEDSVTDPTVETDIPDESGDLDDVTGDDSPIDIVSDDGVLDDPADIGDVADVVDVSDETIDLTDLRPGSASLLGLDAPGLLKDFPGKGIGLANIPDRGVPPGLAARGFGGNDVLGQAGAFSAADLTSVGPGNGRGLGRNR